MVFLTALFFGDTMAAEQKIIEKRGGKVKVVKYKDGSWQLLVNDKPYFIRGVVFNPVNIGQAPDDATQQDWMDEDDNQDGIIDIPYQSWLDKNKNNIRDDDEPLEGDFSLLKKMGVNTIRLYHLPSNNSLVGDIYKSDKNTEIFITTLSIKSYCVICIRNTVFASLLVIF